MTPAPFPGKRQIHFISIHPEFITSALGFGIFRRASAGKTDMFCVHNLRDFATDRHGTIDDRPYGGGDGMVFRPEPLRAALKTLPSDCYVIHFSPSGKPFRQQDSIRLSLSVRPLVMICSRFGGTDQRFLDHYVDEELSVGDYVVSGGELPALTVADAIVRHYPGALGHQDSAHEDSFSEGLEGMLEYPQYTRPKVFEGEPVPELLLSGHHEQIRLWRKAQSLSRTRLRRPDLLPPESLIR